MTNRPIILCLLIPSFLLVASIAAAGGAVPTEVAERFDAAGMLSESDDFAGTYTVTTETVIQKPNGKGRHEETMEIAVSRSTDGTNHRRLVRLIEDGKDVTEKRRKKVEKDLTGYDDQTDEEDEDEDLVDPFGETAGKYTFGNLKNKGDAVLLSFEPKAEHREEKGMAEGTISWNKDSLDPLWIQMKAVTAPSPLKELDLRMEFARQGDAIYMTHLSTSGVAKVLLFTREFDVNVRISEVEAEAP